MLNEVSKGREVQIEFQNIYLHLMNVVMIQMKGNSFLPF